MPLDEYRRKRRPGQTNEPFGEAPAPQGETREGVFVVHLHDATRAHYDLRIEMGGVLASFAVPKGPSLDPDARRLAVHTEDHPIEYLDFEGIIPKGQYGGGPMIAWDRGQISYLETSAEEGVRRGKIDFVLRGFKLHGRFALVKLKNGERDWLLLKKRDEHADAGRDILAEAPRSVLSAMKVDELERASELASELARRARELGGKSRPSAPLSLMIPSPAQTKARMDPGWCYELALEGARVLAHKDGEDVVLPSSAGDLAPLAPEIVRALRASYARKLALDGLLVANGPEGRPSLERLVRRLTEARAGAPDPVPWRRAPLTLLVEDVLTIEGVDVRPVPLTGRKALLSALLPGNGVLRPVMPVEGDAATVLAFCRTHGLDGFVAKRRSSAYVGRTSRDWVLVRVDPKAPEPTRFESAFENARPRGTDTPPQRSRVVVTNRQKVFWPDDGITKGDLCDYYEAIAPTLLLYLRDRPIVLVRYPDGIAGKSFYQWNVPPAMPSWVPSFVIPSDDPSRGGGETRTFIVDDVSSLLYVANLGCIPIHVLACRAETLESCDFLTIDFDVKASSLDAAIPLAWTLRELLEGIGLRGYAKTSGQSGLHVLVPLGPGQSFTTARALADLLGRLIVRQHPDTATMERRIEKRGPRVYVDTGQTGQWRTIVAPYSVRARPGAPVSMPLTWDEVTPGLDPSAFTLRNAPRRVARMGDPMAALLEARPSVPQAVARLEQLLVRAG